MNEDEAKKKWCPIMTNYKGAMDGSDIVKCRGSQCALWTPIPKFTMDDDPNKGRCGLAHPSAR